MACMYLFQQIPDVILQHVYNRISGVQSVCEQYTLTKAISFESDFSDWLAMK